MSAACLLCAGACCESIVLPGFPHEDAQAWLRLHGKERPDGMVVLECRCSALDDGRCSVYAIRPQVCRDYPAGDDACRETVAARRPGLAEEIFALLDGGAQ